MMIMLTLFIQLSIEDKKKKFPDDNNKIELTIPDGTHNAGFIYNPKITYACMCDNMII